MCQPSSEPLISVITVVYNSVDTIEKTIKSVINQSYQNIEHILIDGGSTDGTKDILENYRDHFSFFLSEPDKGFYFGLNKGLNHANGHLISILNSGDWYEVDTISKVVHYFNLFPSIDIYHGLLRFVSPNSDYLYIAGHYAIFLNSGMIEHPTCFITRRFYNLVGDFNTKYLTASDYEWMIRARNKNATFLLVPELLTNFIVGGMSDSLFGNLEQLRIKYDLKLIKKFKYAYSYIYIRFFFALKYIQKKIL